MKVKSRARGFTLIEVMVVVIILGILATVVMPRLMNRPEQARRTKAKVQLRVFQQALGFFKLDCGRYPTTTEGLQALVVDPGMKCWRDGGYLQDGSLPNDPWGNPYVYVSPGLYSKDFDVETYGSDGEDGGEDDDADIESWNLANEAN